MRLLSCVTGSQTKHIRLSLSCDSESSIDVEIANSVYNVKWLACLSELERLKVSDAYDQLLYICDELTPLDLQTLLRLIQFSPVPIVVNATRWNEDSLCRLLQCGRVTFTPGVFDVKRLADVIELSKLRYKLASQQLHKIQRLESTLSTQKLLIQVKAKLQSNGLSEQQAHQLLQKQAMQSGITIEQLVQRLPLNAV